MTYLVLNGDIMVQKGVFWNFGEHSYCVYYPIIYYQSIKVYRDERMNIGKIYLNNWCQINIQMQP